jgi:dipeptidyl aminopeptidase/acylaminoacyl peptidase
VTVAALGALLAVVFGFLWLSSQDTVAETPLRRFTLSTEGTPIHPSISPNGRHIAYVSGPANERVLWVQDLDQQQARAVVGPTSLITANSGLSWSPDSQFVAFQSDDTVLQKVAASGGPVVTLTELSRSSRSAWTPDGESAIFMSDDIKLHSVPARGGEAKLWLEAQQEGVMATAPAFFSLDEGTQKFLYGEGKTYLDAQIIAFDRTTGRREILAAGGSSVYASSGHVIYNSADPRGAFGPYRSRSTP